MDKPKALTRPLYDSNCFLHLAFWSLIVCAPSHKVIHFDIHILLEEWSSSKHQIVIHLIVATSSICNKFVLHMYVQLYLIPTLILKFQCIHCCCSNNQFGVMRRFFCFLNLSRQLYWEGFAGTYFEWISRVQGSFTGSDYLHMMQPKKQNSKQLLKPYHENIQTWIFYSF